MEYDTQNIFARIIRGEIPCRKVYEDTDVLAFHDVHPAAPVHVLVVPKSAYISFDDFLEKSPPEAVARFFLKLRNIAADLGVQESGYRLITNHGTDAAQSVPHFHVHLLAGRPLGGLLPGDALVQK
jgi:diadenosine tetraphosphate (Ap4A) HIT family hydrolase